MRLLWRGLKGLFAEDDSDDMLILAKHQALLSQIPLLYIVLIINMAFVAVAFREAAPWALALAAPVALSAVFLLRLVQWLVQSQQPASAAKARLELQRTSILSTILAIGLDGWLIALMPYGSVQLHAQLIIFAALTGCACMMCLLQLRSALLRIACLIALTLLVAAWFEPALVITTMALNALLATAGMSFVLLRQNRQFVELVRNQQQLQERQAETQQLSDENHRLATSDALTGLPNRRSFSANLSGALLNAREQKSPLAILLLDFNGFKTVNDIYGHATGDALLVKAAARLRTFIPLGCFCARLGGDEFVIATTHLGEQAQIEAFAAELALVLNQPYRLSQAELVLSVSIGISVFGEGGQNQEEMFEAADYALYQAKGNLPAAPVFFNETHHHAIRLLQKIDQNLRNAAFEAELSLAYQPVVQASSRQLIGYEALARWTNTELGSINPLVFIAAAGKVGMAEQVTRVLFRKLLADLQHIPEGLTVSFNLSSRDLINPQAILGLVRDIQQSGVTARRLQFEISEQAVHADFNRIDESLRLLRNMGCAICLDNFGSGQTTLSYAYQLPVSAIKIDSAFMAACDSDERARHTLEAIVSLCDRLDLTSIAVGVETETQARFAEDAGCMQLQGYLIAKPMPIEAIAATLQQVPLRRA